MKRIFTILTTLLAATAVGAQSYGDRFERALSDVLRDVEQRFAVRLKYNVDTAGLRLPYADFRIRPYSVEETLRNLCAPFDFVPWDQGRGVWKIKPFEYPRRKPADGKALLIYLQSRYADKVAWEARRDSLRREVRQRLGIDAQQQRLAPLSVRNPRWGKPRRHDGYMVQNFCLETINGHTVKGSVYAPLPAKRRKTTAKRPLILCPNGHFARGRYNEDLQRRYGTLARMGAVCVSYDLWGWGESEDEVGAEAHHTDTAHVMQALNGLRILDAILRRGGIDEQRIGVNGGSGGGTQTVLLGLLDDRFAASCPVVSLSAWFDGGCPCESGRPIQLSGGGTCNAELAACFAPKPMLVVSDGGDWTAQVPESEYPYLQHIYDFYGARGAVSNVHLPAERHDFGPNKRQAVYRFFIDTFGLDEKMLDEDHVTIEDESVLRFAPKREEQPQKQR